MDSWGGFPASQGAEGYVSVALVPSTGADGSVLIVSSTGGSALNAGADFLANDASLQELRRRLSNSTGGLFPYFEALISVHGRGASGRETSIVLCRRPANLTDTAH